MADDSDKLTVELSRRNVLGSVGALGGAAALGGAGTAAFFSDEEEFENNRIVAGELDLKVDWQEHYSDWMGKEKKVIRFPKENERADFLLPPNPKNPDSRPIRLKFRKNKGILDLKKATAIEAFPDGLNVYDDGTIGSDLGKQDGKQDEIPKGKECEVLTSVDDPKRPALRSKLRTRGKFGGQKTKPGDPLINIKDAKPGDFGEVTLSFHLCDNDGFVWLKGKLRDKKDGNVPKPIEPSWNDPDEDARFVQTDSGTKVEGGKVELLDAIRTRVWLDNKKWKTSKEKKKVPGGKGNNVLDRGEHVIIRNKSLRETLRLLHFDPAEDKHGIPLQPMRKRRKKDGNNDSGYDSNQNGGNGPGLCEQTDWDTITTDSNPGATPSCEDLGLTAAGGRIEGGDLPDTGETETYDTEFGDLRVTINEDRTVDWQTADGSTFDDVGFCVAKVIVKGGPQGNNIYNYDVSGEQSSGDEGLKTPGTNPAGQNFDVSYLEFCVDEDANGGDGDDMMKRRNCFPGSTTFYVCLAWWLPVDHANEIMGDRVKFDVGFYTEQCRHNDGSGMPPEPDGPSNS